MEREEQRRRQEEDGQEKITKKEELRLLLGVLGENENADRAGELDERISPSLPAAAAVIFE